MYLFVGGLEMEHRKTQPPLGKNNKKDSGFVAQACEHRSIFFLGVATIWPRGPADASEVLRMKCNGWFSSVVLDHLEAISIVRVHAKCLSFAFLILCI